MKYKIYEIQNICTHKNAKLQNYSGYYSKWITWCMLAILHWLEPSVLLDEMSPQYF